MADFPGIAGRGFGADQRGALNDLLVVPLSLCFSESFCRSGEARASSPPATPRRFVRTDNRIRIAKNYYYFIFLIALRCRDAATRVGKMSFR
jgi:hypothetical protein